MSIVITPLNAFEYLERDQNAVLIDIRSAQQISVAGCTNLTTLNRKNIWVSWHPNINVGLEEEFANRVSNAIKKLLPNLRSLTDVSCLVICRRGHSSVPAAEILIKYLGVKAFSIIGGFSGKNGWLDSFLPFRLLVSIKMC